MKAKLSIATIALFLLLFKINAQSFILQTLAGTVISYGDTLVITGTINDFTLMSPLTVTNNAGVQKNVMAERTILSMVPGAANAFAWGLMMYPPSVNISVDPAIINAGATDSSFQTWYFTNNTAGVSYIKYCFYDENNPADSAWMVFQFNVSPLAGLADVVIKNAVTVYPNPSKGFFNLLIENNFTQLVIEVCELNGEPVTINSFSKELKYLTIDLSNQPSGIYLLKIRDQKNSTLKTIKLMKQ